MRSPAFQFYPQDFLVGTADLSCEEVGAYIRLLCYQWAKEGLPNDEGKLKKLSGISDGLSLGNVSVKFRLCDDGLLRNDRLAQTKLDQDHFHEKQRQNGKQGGNPNFKKGHKNPYYQQVSKDNPEDIRPHNPKINSSSSSSPSSSNNKREAFTKPTSTEVSDYAKSINFNLDGEYFLDYCETRGWKMKSGVPMKDWKAAVRTWKHNDLKNKGNFNGKPPSKKFLSGEEIRAQYGK